MKKKALSLLLVLVMVLSMLPVSSLATGLWGNLELSENLTAEAEEITLADTSTLTQPFENKSGVHYRIPSIVTLDNGTLVAAADQRNKDWGNPDDCRDIDTIVAISEDNGANWSTEIVNDTGENAPTGTDFGSGTYIDPALASDGETIYMIVDLFPGTKTEKNSSQVAQSGTGVDSNGNLLLMKFGESSYSYYLYDGAIYSTDGAAVSDYTVDAFFNLYDDNVYCGNLFDCDTDFQPLMTSYLIFRKSTDGGETWTDPKIINGDVKDSSNTYYVVSPGKAMVTSNGTLVFPCYSSSGTSLIYSDDGGESWHRSSSVLSNASEGELVELPNGTLRFFYRYYTYSSDKRLLKYADASRNSESGYVWSDAVSTGIATQSNVDLGAMMYSKKTSDGNKVILVSTSIDTSGPYSRNNGRIFAFTLDDSYNMTLKNTYEVNNSDFSYSCMTELQDGSIGLLYENGDAGGITYISYDVESVTGLSFYNTVTDATTNVSVSLPKNSTIEVTPNKTVSALNGTNYVAYNISINGGAYTTGAKVTLPIGDLTGNLYGFVVNADGTITKAMDGELNDDGTFTFTAPHFSVVGVAEQAANDTRTETVNLKVGETSTPYTVSYSAHVGTQGESTTTDGIASYIVTYGTGEGTYTGNTAKKTSLSDGDRIVISTGSQYLTLNGTSFDSTTDAAEATVWTVAKSGNSYTLQSGDYYLSRKNSRGDYSLTASTSSATWSYNSSDCFYFTQGRNTYYLRYSSYDSGWTVSSSSSYYTKTYAYGTTYTEGSKYTTVSFTGLNPGTTEVTIGDTTYHVVVSKAEKSVTLKLGDTLTLDGTSATIKENTASAISLENMVVTALAAGTAKVETDTTIYTITVVETPPALKPGESPFRGSTGQADGKEITGLVIMVGTSYILNISSQYGSASKWEADNTYCTVSNGTVTGKEVGDGYVTVTIDSKNYTIPVTVVSKPSATGSSTRTIDIYNSQSENCTAYYSFNGADFVEFPEGTLFYAKHPTGTTDLVVFAAIPDEGYALTHMDNEKESSMFHVVMNEDETGYGFTGQTCNDNLDQTSGGYVYLHDQLIAYVVNNSGSKATDVNGAHTICEKAYQLGAHGAFLWSNGVNNTSIEHTTYFLAQKLPTVEKKINSGKTEINYGDTIDYVIEITIPKTDKSTSGSNQSKANTIAYTNITVIDELLKFANDISQSVDSTNGKWNISNCSSDTSQDVTYTLTYSVKVTLDNFAELVDESGDVVNTANFAYTYKAQYSKGSRKCSSTAVAKIKVQTETYVADFGLPIEIDLSGILSEATVTSGSSVQNANVAPNNKKITYTPTKTLTGEDVITISWTSGSGKSTGKYQVRVVPASNVLYEASFLSQTTQIDRKVWTASTASFTKQETQKVGETNKNVFGYDAAYQEITGVKDAFTVSGLKTTSDASQPLTTTFYGNGFDLIGSCGPDTGSVMLTIKNSENKVVKTYLVNTLYNDTTYGTLTQVPLVHAMLDAEDTYTATIRAYAPIQGAKTASYAMTAEPAAIYADLAEMGVSIDEVEFIELSDTMTASAVELYADTAAATQGNPSSDGYSVTIDAFRVYRSTDNDNYPTNEKGYVYTNVLENIVTNGQVQKTFYKENGTIEFENAAAYQTSGGPQNELYLLPSQSVTFGALGYDSIQVSLRAVSGDPQWNNTSISSEVEMYYSLEPTSDGVFTIANTSQSGLLGIGNLKLKSGTPVQTAAELGDEIVLQSIRTVLFSAPVESEPEYDPFVDVKLRTTSLLRKKLVTLTITTSTDVESLTVNGYKLYPINKWMVQSGRATTYTYILADTVSKNTTKTYEITAVNANGQSCTVTKQA